MPHPPSLLRIPHSYWMTSGWFLAFLLFSPPLHAAAPMPGSSSPALRTPRTPAQVAAVIDQAIDQRLRDKNIPASPRTDDAEFIRRATLHLLGRIPRAERVIAFLDSKEPDKRAQLIDELLASPEYGRHFGTLWQNRIGNRDSAVGKDREHALFPWLADSFNRNRRWSTIVSDMLLAEGELKSNTATGFYVAEGNTIEGVPQADRIAASVASLFLGVNLRCAQCHNHPFAEWKQTELWGLAAFFGRVSFTTKDSYYKILRESTDIRDRNDKHIPTARPDATIEIPGKSKVVAARFLAGRQQFPVSPKEATE